MSKKLGIKSLMASLLNKNKLETDAVPVEENPSDTNQTNCATNSTLPSLTNELVLVESPTEMVPARTDIMNGNLLPQNMMLNQTRADVIYQISNANGVHIGPAITIGENTKETSKNDAKSPIRRTQTIFEMMTSTEDVTIDMLEIIAKHLGEDWRRLMRLLNFSDGQIENAIADYHVEGHREIKYQLLLEWSRNDENPTLGKISTILWKNDYREVVEQMKLFYKLRKMKTTEGSI